MIVEPLSHSFRTRSWFLVVASIVLLLGFDAAARAQSSRNVIDFIEIEGVLDPPSARYLMSEIASAEASRAEALVVRVDGRVALRVSVNQIVKRMTMSEVPIVVWVAPSGAEAGSASAVIAMASHVLVMAPGARIGPARPEELGLKGSELEDYFAALPRGSRSENTIRRLAETEFGSEEAVNAGLADFTAGAGSLYDKLDGRSVSTAAGNVTLETKTAQIRFHKMGLIDRLLHGALRPDAAYLLLLLGLFGLIFELYHPGIGAAASLGAALGGLALYSFSVLPTSWVALSIVGAGVGLLWLDMHRSAFGRISLAGLIALGGGSLALFPGSPGELRLHWWVVLLAELGTLAFFVGAMTAAIRARLSKGGPVSREIIGARGVARTDIAPNGEVVTAGKTWRARTAEAAIAEGAEVVVRSVAGVVLIVEEIPAQSAE
jgi:membrane-bound serine protease (ClpP class)